MLLYSPIPHRRRGLWSACLLLALTVAACGGSSQNLTQCGNGRIDTGEQCDDGNTIDTDACTSVCQNARCGDGAIEQDVETCDGENVGMGVTCESLGLSPGASLLPACEPSCAAYDASPCGPAFTPTPQRPTATPTVTFTPTPMTMCGNGLLEPGETCTSCPEDCQPAACTPSGTRSKFAVAVSSSRVPANISVELAYRSSVISIPGSGNDLTVRQRVRFAPPLPQSFIVNDLDYAVDITSLLSSGLPSAPKPFATADFDDCSGADAPTVDDLSCVIVRCSDAAGAIAGCACVVSPQL